MNLNKNIYDLESLNITVRNVIDPEISSNGWCYELTIKDLESDELIYKETYNPDDTNAFEVYNKWLNRPFGKHAKKFNKMVKVKDEGDGSYAVISGAEGTSID